MAKITFLGAAGCVTGSKYLVEADGKRLLVDCGLFQGNKELRLRNWERLPEEPARFDWAVLTHAHLRSEERRVGKECRSRMSRCEEGGIRDSEQPELVAIEPSRRHC